MSETTAPSADADAGTPAWSAIAFGVTFPTALTLAYFVVLAGEPRWLVQGAYTVGKAVQFAFPALWVARARRRFPWPSRPEPSGVVAGLLFGAAVLACGVAGYLWVLKPAGFLGGAAADAVRSKIASFGVDSVGRYAALGAFYSVIHSAAEEYYWRWFVFRELRHACGVARAIAWSSVGFAAHHVIILGTFLGWTSPWTYVLAAAVGMGGAYWAWLYQRSGSLLGPWLGHLLADVTIFTIGYCISYP